MEIRPYDPSMAEGLTDVYNRAVADVPLCWSARTEELAAWIVNGAGLADNDPPLQAMQTLVAVDAGGETGFIDFGIRPETEADPKRRGMIRFLTYPPGQRSAGQTLLEAAEAELAAEGIDEIDAFEHHYTYFIYQFHSSYLSDRLAHVAALLGLNDYRRINGEVFLAWTDFQPPALPSVDASVELVVESTPAPGKRPDIVVKAMSGGRRVGICSIERVGDYTDDESARNWCFVEWLCVDSALQGRGLGKLLLTRALAENRSAGYRHIAISTSVDNYRAAVFYTNFGFALTDWTYGLRWELAE